MGQLRKRQYQFNLVVFAVDPNRVLVGERQTHVLWHVVEVGGQGTVGSPRHPGEQLRQVERATVELQLFQRVVDGRLVQLQVEPAIGRRSRPRRMGAQLVRIAEPHPGDNLLLRGRELQRHQFQTQPVEQRHLLFLELLRGALQLWLQLRVELRAGPHGDLLLDFHPGLSLRLVKPVAGDVCGTSGPNSGVPSYCVSSDTR